MSRPMRLGEQNFRPPLGVLAYVVSSVDVDGTPNFKV